MRHFIGHREIVTGDDTLRLALDLWLGPGEETADERAARLDAARDIFTADPALLRRAVSLSVDTFVSFVTEMVEQAQTHTAAAREVTVSAA